MAEVWFPISPTFKRVFLLCADPNAALYKTSGYLQLMGAFAPLGDKPFSVQLLYHTFMSPASLSLQSHRQLRSHSVINHFWIKFSEYLCESVSV